MTEHKDLVGQELFSVTHKRIEDSIMLNMTEMEFAEDVLVVLKEHEESNEIFWLTAPESIILESNGTVELTAESKSSIDLPFDVLSPGTTTGLMIYNKKASSKEQNLTITEKETRKEPTKPSDLTLQETETLMGKALDFMSSESSPIKYLYRNKSLYYYTSILNGHGIMETYRKDYNGDERSCINGNINGLFFSTAVIYGTNEPLHFSYYGKIRLLIPPQMIITEDTNMYFSDFYCLYDHHYVTVVVTISGSHADNFCKDRLPKLDARNNRFICTDNFLLFSITSSLTVEIFYTEDIDISSGVNFTDDVELKGNGKSTKFGIQKNKNCTYCNL
ncbi:phytanoyl-CoA hydroxylase-interacting protein-like isoform X2 [Gigantopelta aegis]|uniref:phytanoyl-CoA hydroxylase-interacting protein-like isoform X2 n=1 Tax=Gigantopelta aegis TaxID=1735272 RepID=UPI001B88B925|nr:phytanoyl-CoA hydroxylase-interacting protein-like isoform X2 [Gigantopelta aegis]